MRFLVDESMGKVFAEILTKAGHDVIFVGDAIPEVDDEIIISFAEKESRILVTSDKDFGKLVFKLKMETKGVIFFRTWTRNPEERFELVKDILHKAEGNFIVVSEGRIRIKRL